MRHSGISIRFLKHLLTPLHNSHGKAVHQLTQHCGFILLNAYGMSPSITLLPSTPPPPPILNALSQGSNPNVLRTRDDDEGPLFFCQSCPVIARSSVDCELLCI
jgi:hypothetical protein